MVIQLQRIINRDTPKFISESVARFKCRDKDVETFLQHKAFDFERRNKSRTYLIFDEKRTLLGYYALSIKSLPFGADASKAAIKSIDGYSKDVKSVGIILIGQFGKDTLLAKEVKGAHLLELCMVSVYQAQRIIGGRYVMLECQNIEEEKERLSGSGFGGSG